MFNNKIRVFFIISRKGAKEANGAKKEIQGFMWRYNDERRHSALNYETPLHKLKKIAELLPKL
jgi:hypothetical protein